MPTFGRPDKTGRSCGRIGLAERKLIGPPKGSRWGWVTDELLGSPAWRTMSVHCARFVSFLLLEHASHVGLENGHLQAPYAQLVAYGISRRKIAGAIAEAEARGLVRVTERGGIFGIDAKRTPSKYRLTWIGCLSPAHEATNDWRRFQPTKRAFRNARGRKPKLTP